MTATPTEQSTKGTKQAKPYPTTDEPTDGPQAQKLREQMLLQEKAEGDRRS
jgi:hypothetical protein